MEALLDSARASSLYRTAPQLDTDQPEFWNAAVSGHWSGTPEGLLERLLMWECGRGRVRDPLRPKGPRLVDLDFLTAEQTVLQTPRLQLPHPGLPSRRFALQPLVELVPLGRSPVSGRLWADVLEQVSGQGVDRTGRTW